MFAKRSTILHKPSGVALQTPLLIPSFSSKGFARSKKDQKSEIRKILSTTSEFLTEAYLISAYDIFYGHLPKPKDLPCKPDLLILDSGGYEISTDRDYSAVIDPLPASEPWNLDNLRTVLNDWPEEIPTVIVSYDHHEERKPVAEQVVAARNLFQHYPKHLHLFLLKPETPSQTLLDEAIKSLLADAAQFGSFDLIGVTEKELGRTMLDRMVQISRLRRSLDEANVKIPIHVFGSLDPISVCLYFLSGAEVFDGLTWIRYGYEDGRAIYTHNFGALRYGLNQSDNLVKSRALADNYYYLQDFQRRLQEFETTKKWEKLAPHEDLAKNALDSLVTRLNRGT